MNKQAKRVEGFIPFQGYKTWYCIVDKENSSKLPLLCLHGGPGAPHDYLESLEDIANTGRKVIFYDQIGCGNSDQPHNPSLWKVPFFIEELKNVCKHLNLDKVHILGQSWGGMLAMEYALTKPKNIASLIIANSPASMKQWASETNRLRSQLPSYIQKILDKHEKNGTTANPEYEEAAMEFYKKHVCRIDPWPESFTRTLAKLSKNSEVYNTMNGPCEFFVTGNLKNWDITNRLKEITNPTLIISGKYDEATPLISETVHKGITNSEWILFNNSSHITHYEERELYMKTISDFMDKIETQL